MNFQAAMVLLTQGKRIGSASVFGDTTEYMTLDADTVVIEEDGDYVSDLTLTSEILNATDFYEIVVATVPAQLTAYLDPAKGRWVSTSNPERRRAEGLQVKVFVAQA